MMRWHAFEQKREKIARELERLKTTWVNPRMLDKADAERVLGKEIEREYCLYDLLRRPEVSYASLMTLPGAQAEDVSEIAEQVEIQAKYQGYIERQRGEIARQEGQETTQVAGKYGLFSGARIVDRSAAKTESASAADGGTGGAHFGRDAGRDFIVAGAFEAGLQTRKSGMNLAQELAAGIAQMGLDVIAGTAGRNCWNIWRCCTNGTVCTTSRRYGNRSRW